MSTTATPPPASPPALDAQTPLLFLPVHIETRFMDLAGGTSELWVRIYPDQISVNSHEPELTSQEISDAGNYWTVAWSQPAGSDLVQSVWSDLVTRYGAPRSAWIVLKMTPTNLPPGTAPGPNFPQAPKRSGSWTKPAIADLLPDSWTVVTISQTATETDQAIYRSGPVQPGLAVGLTPSAPTIAPGSIVDSGMHWLVDFDAALAAGMALKIPLAAAQRTAGFDRIFVYGLRQKNAEGATDFASVLDAHHYTDGFALVPQGAPSNNTPDAQSEYSRKDPGAKISFAVERGDPLNADPADDGNVFAKFLGIDPFHLDHVRHADGFGARNGTDMLTAIWPATLGYFLSQMMADVFTPDQVEAAREYLMVSAIARGPIPAFRAGVTPYGVLPATSLFRYPRDTKPGGPVEAGLVPFLLRLRASWLAASANAPHMQNTGDPDAQLIGLLGMDASSTSFRGRQVLGDDFLWNYIGFLGFNTNLAQSWWTQHQTAGRQLLNSFNYNQWDPRVIHTGISSSSYPVPFPTVQDGPLSETAGLNADADLGGGQKGNYIQWLRQASIGDIQAENYPGPKPAALLYKILRQSIILEYSRLAGHSEVSAGNVLLPQLREAEIRVGQQLKPQETPVGPWDMLARPAIPNPQQNWGQYLLTLDPPPGSAFSALKDLRSSFDRLAALPTAELDRLFTETLDSCSHRLDVWITAIATAILQRTRKDNNALHLGCFGWVEEVRPGPSRSAIQGSDLQQVQQVDQARAKAYNTPAVLPVPFEPLADNGGFILAPSPAQASTAAILRNGYMTHKGTNEQEVLSVDLSSERVRKALELLDGVRQGQSLNALLGYLFESGLHALQLDKYTQPFRDKFPIVGSKLTASSDPTAAVAASNVVDGLALRTGWDDGQLAEGSNWGTGLPGTGQDSDQKAIIGLLQKLDDYADALGDLSLAETVFQIVRGNFERGSSLMDVISRGGQPPDPEVINSQRGGLDLTYRVLLLLAGLGVVDPAWNVASPRPRALAEPRLNAWLTRALPSPASVYCEVNYQDSNGSKNQPVHLSDLHLSPLDCLEMADTSDKAQLGELENRIYAAWVPSNATNVQIDYQPANAPTGRMSFPDFFFLVKSLRTMIGAGRPLMPQDLTVPENILDPNAPADLTELQNRATALVNQLQTDIDNLNHPTQLRSALLQSSFYGVPDSIPRSNSDDDPGLPGQAQAVAEVLQAHLNQAKAINITMASLSDLLGIFSTILGDRFVVLPPFLPPDWPSLQTAFGQSASLFTGDLAAPCRWVLQLTEVRPAMSRLDTAITLARIVANAMNPGGVPLPDYLFGQLPTVAGDRWLGLPINTGCPPAKGRMAFASIGQGDPITENSYAGLLLDEWLERIPSVKENAGVAFHYEEPKARPPQALLLAVCPDNRSSWDDDLIQGILSETLDLAKIRTVDLNSVQQVGQLLPALYFALNLRGATVSANFALKEAQVATPTGD